MGISWSGNKIQVTTYDNLDKDIDYFRGMTDNDISYMIIELTSSSGIVRQFALSANPSVIMSEYKRYNYDKKNYILANFDLPSDVNLIIENDYIINQGDDYV